MAQETILKVSLKEYKQGIDELRASLLGLDKDSEEYGKIVEQIAERQDKLNDAMNAGKQAANAVDGSYNALVQTLSQLKKEWKNMEIGTPEWEAMAVRIDEINDQLKDADAKVGVFTRNVGDYANAFEEGFKQAMGGLSKMPGALGQVGGITKQLIPLIKQTTNTAVAGLTGVRKALMSTGIGALIVAVGLLIANFDKLKDMFKNNNNVIDKYIENTKKLREELESMDADYKHYLEVRRAAGDDEESLLQQEKQREEERQKAMAETIEKNSLELDKWATKHEDFVHKYNRRTEAIRYTWEGVINWINKKAGKLGEWAFGDAKRYEELQKEQDELVKVYEESLNRVDVINATLKKKEDERKKKEADDRKAKIDAEKKTLQTILDRVEDANRTEIEKLTKQYQEEYKLLKKYGKDTTLLTEQYNKSITEINERAIDSITSELMKYQPSAYFNREYRKAADVLEKFQQVVDRTFPPDAILETEDITEDMIEKAQKLGLVAGNTAQEFAYAWNYAYENFKGTADDFAISMAEVTDEYNRMQENFQKSNNLKAFYWNQLEMLTEAYGFYEKNITQIQIDLHKFEHGMEVSENFMKDWEGNNFETTEVAYAYWNKFVESLIKKWDELGIEVNIAKDDMHNYAVGVINDLNNAEAEFAEFGKDSNWQWFTSTSFIYDAYQKRLDAAIWYRDNLEIIEGETESQRLYRYQQAEEEVIKIKREYAQKHIEVSQTLNNDLLSVWDSLINIRESKLKQEENAEVKSLRQRLKAQGKGEREINEEIDKVRDEYGRKAFEESKKSKISLGWVETIQGALAAFMGYQDFPQPYGAILGAAAVAATMAAGVAQIEAIKATEYGQASNSSSPVAVVNATPRMADYSPDTIQNLTGASETQNLANALQQTPIYVSVTDINNAQAKVTDRNNESSF